MLYKERNTKYISAYQFISLEDLGNRFEDSGIESGSVLFNKERKVKCILEFLRWIGNYVLELLCEEQNKNRKSYKKS